MDSPDNIINISNTNAASQMRLTLDAGIYAYGDNWYGTAATGGGIADANFTAGGAALSAVQVQWNVTSNVPTRDFLFRDTAIDMRWGAGFAPPNGGGFVTRNGIKFNVASTAISSEVASPIVFGNNAETYQLIISPDSVLTLDSNPSFTYTGNGLFEWALLGYTNTGRTTKCVLLNQTGFPWATRMSAHHGGSPGSTASSSQNVILENHVTPTTRFLTPLGQPLAATKQIWQFRRPTFGPFNMLAEDLSGFATVNAEVEFRAQDSATWEGLADNNGRITAGATNGVTAATQGGIPVEVYYRTGNSGDSASGNYATPASTFAAHTAGNVITYSVFRLGREIIHERATTIGTDNISGFTGGGLPDVGDIVLNLDPLLNIEFEDQTQTGLTVAAGGTITVDSTLPNAELYINNVLVTGITVDRTTGNVTLPAGRTVVAADTVLTISHGDFPTMASSLEDVYAMAYRYAYDNEQALPFTHTGELNTALNITFSDTATVPISIASGTMTIRVPADTVESGAQIISGDARFTGINAGTIDLDRKRIVNMNLTSSNIINPLTTTASSTSEQVAITGGLISGNINVATTDANDIFIRFSNIIPGAAPVLNLANTRTDPAFGDVIAIEYPVAGTISAGVIRRAAITLTINNDLTRIPGYDTPIVDYAYSLVTGGTLVNRGTIGTVVSGNVNSGVSLVLTTTEIANGSRVRFRFACNGFDETTLQMTDFTIDTSSPATINLSDYLTASQFFDPTRIPTQPFAVARTTAAFAGSPAVITVNAIDYARPSDSNFLTTATPRLVVLMGGGAGQAVTASDAETVAMFYSVKSVRLNVSDDEFYARLLLETDTINRIQGSDLSTMRIDDTLVAIAPQIFQSQNVSNLSNLQGTVVDSPSLERTLTSGLNTSFTRVANFPRVQGITTDVFNSGVDRVIANTDAAETLLNTEIVAARNVIIGNL